MIVVISPAKKQEFSNKQITLPVTPEQPKFKQEAFELASRCSKYRPEELQNLMNVSENIAELNYNRFQNFSEEFNSSNSAPALYVFKGDVYSAMQPEKYAGEELEFAREQLRILSGLYGLLKPLDLMQPYRLEMSTKLPNSAGQNLYKYWSEKITKELEGELALHNNKYIINLASTEYSSVIDRNNFKYPVIDIDFKQERSSKLKTIAILAKKARGMMADYMVANKITSIEELKHFDLDGYKFSSELSSDNKLIFVK
jgi:cytoplasmic iron level regulating protein YaaA (DUF328/UPF0246 family)